MTDLVPVPAAELVPVDVAAASPVDMYLQSLGSVDSRRTMQGSLNQLARLLDFDDATQVPWHELRADRTTWLKSMLVEQYAPSTARKMLAALSGVLNQAWRLELITEEDLRRMTAWGKVSGEGLTGANAGRHVTSGEVRAMFLACADFPHVTTAVRNATMLAILFGVGTRRAELVALDIDDIDPETGKAKIRGKGNKIRIGYCVGGTLDAVQEWIRVRGPQPGPLFVAVNKAGRLDPAMRRLSTQAVYALLVRLARKAGVKHLSPHDARRTFGGNLFDAGVDAPTVQKLFGHASLATTGKYDRRGENTKEAASGKLHIPYVPHGGGGYGPSEGDAF